MDNNPDIKQFIRDNHRIYQPKLIMYSFRIDKKY